MACQRRGRPGRRRPRRSRFVRSIPVGAGMAQRPPGPPAALPCGAVWLLAWAFTRKDEGRRMKDEQRQRAAALAVLLFCLLSSFVLHPSSFAEGVPQPELVVIVRAATPDKDTVLVTPA